MIWFFRVEKNQNMKTAEVGQYVTIGRMKGKIAIGDKLYKVTNKKLMEEARRSYQITINASDSCYVFRIFHTSFYFEALYASLN